MQTWAVDTGTGPQKVSADGLTLDPSGALFFWNHAGEGGRKANVLIVAAGAWRTVVPAPRGGALAAGGRDQ